MPVIDMPLEKLRAYQGTNPCPNDFDEFWDKGLAEMRALTPNVELREATFQAPFARCFDMYFTGVGGARIHAKLLTPSNGRRGPGLVMFHGYTGSAGDWVDKLPYVAAGFTVAALDCRGQAGQSEDVGGVSGNTHSGHIIRGLADGPEKLLFRQIFLDTAQLAGLVMEMDQVDESRVAASGGSQGGGLTIACAALEPRIRKAVPVYPFLSDYRRVWNMDLAERAYREIRDYFRRYDADHSHEEEIFTRLGYIDVQNLAKRIRGEVLMATGLMDDVCPPSTQFAIYNKITAPKQMQIYPDFGHEGLPGFADQTYQFLLSLAE